MESSSPTGHTMRIVFETSPIAMCCVLFDGSVVRKNAAYDALGRGERSVLDLVRAGERDRLSATLREVAAGERRTSTLDVALALADDRWCEISIVPMHGGTGDVMLHIVEITERRHRETRLREQAERDPLTGLHNRQSFRSVLADRLEAAPSGTLMYLDLDGFKAVNDLRGHQCGDEVLVATARALQESVSEPGIVGRLGGDEFAVLVDLEGSSADALGATLIRRINLAASLLGNPRITASIGMAGLRPGCDIETLMTEVDRAMYAAKRSGKARCVRARPIQAGPGRGLVPRPRSA